MFRSLISALNATIISFRFWRELQIRSSEARRYLGKSFNLGLCFAAFVKPTTTRGLIAAGRAAFLSCSYDVVTDWRSFSSEFREPFEKQLKSLVSESAAELTMRLYWAEVNGSLEDDGLERGAVAAEFITEVVGSRTFFAPFGIRKLGHLLQIVDDIIDYEHDTAHGELNCLSTPRAPRHLAFFNENKQQMIDLFQRDRVMKAAIVLASRKAEKMDHSPLEKRLHQP